MLENTWKFAFQFLKCNHRFDPQNTYANYVPTLFQTISKFAVRGVTVLRMANLIKDAKIKLNKN